MTLKRPADFPLQPPEGDQQLQFGWTVFGGYIAIPEHGPNEDVGVSDNRKEDWVILIHSLWGCVRVEVCVELDSRLNSNESACCLMLHGECAIHY